MFKKSFRKLNNSSKFASEAKFDAINKTQALVEFNTNGIIQDANKNFLEIFEYSLTDIKDKHHNVLVEKNYADSEDYKKLWENIKEGKSQSSQYKCIGKNGQEIWLQASYIPIFNKKGIIKGVIKTATDITEHTLRNVDNVNQINAINRALAIIHFSVDGTIQWANENFLNTFDYNLNEIKDKKHNIFINKSHANSEEYNEFWNNLRQGKFQRGEFMRIDKNGKTVWINASYNPIMDDNNRVIKVVKLASDITHEKINAANYQGQIEAINKVQAIIHFNLDGSIIDANEIFLKILGYELDEIVGKHHSIFVENSYRTSKEYKIFWDKLKRGEYQTAEYKRICKDGKEVWIQASYNPIFDFDGNVIKVVKFANDITQTIIDRREKNELQKDISIELENVSDALNNANKQANGASEASDETDKNVQALAAGIEEFDASIASLAKGMESSLVTSDQAFERVLSGEESTQRLLEAANTMTSIVELIQDIASQIHLLSLNATIESARAGEAGHGFAVVANEVKKLAGQAASATDQISSKINDIQVVSNEVNVDFKSIQSSLGELRDFVKDTTNNVQQQSIATREMAENMQSAAKRVSTINHSINQIASATKQVRDATTKVEEMSRSIL